MRELLMGLRLALELPRGHRLVDSRRASIRAM